MVKCLPRHHPIVRWSSPLHVGPPPMRRRALCPPRRPPSPAFGPLPPSAPAPWAPSWCDAL
eukprot:12242742-Alexandrium_andersonii.AAC.1